MALVKKLNVVLTIPDDLVDSYMNKGYNVINENGQVIREAIPNDLGQLKILITQQKEKIAELEKQIVELKAKETIKAKVIEKPESVEIVEKKSKKKSNSVKD